MKTVLTISFLLITFLSFSQSPGQDKLAFAGGEVKGNTRIVGVVVDSVTNEPIPFATVALNDPQTDKPIDGSLADVEGKFSLGKLKEGTYVVAVSFIGFQTRTFRNIVIDGKKEEIDLGSIKLQPSVQMLKEVTVEGMRSLIEEKVDRTVYNAENDQTNKGGDATDVLRKVPMLSVDLDGNVSLRGSSNIMVLINNRPSTIAANSVADALKQIPSDMIKSVEVITSPSAKYDAEGSSGIINIITKKNSLEGFSLNVDGSAGLRGSNLGLNGSYKKGKMGFSLGGFGRAGYNINGSFKNTQTTISNGETILNIQRANTKRENMFGRYQLGWDYEINEKNYITTSVQFGLRNMKNYQDKLYTESYTNAILDTTTLANVNTNDLSNTVDVNVNFTHTFNKPQKEWSLAAQYSRNNRNNDFVNNILNTSDFSLNSLRKNENSSYNQEITIQTDYSNPITKNQVLEIGAKEILRHVTSDYRLLTAGSDGQYVAERGPAFANVFNYDQAITSGYFSYTLGFLKTYTIKAGSRYEYTTIDAHLQNEDDRGIPSYGVLVPSVNLSKKLKNGNTIKAAYNRRIQRPSIQFLNPNIQNSNPLFSTIGNPDLRPEFTNNYEIGYNTFIKSSSLSFTAFTRNTNNAIQGVRQAIGDTILTTFQNIGKENAYGMSLFANINISNKFSLNGGTDVYYADLKNNNPNPLYSGANQGWVVSGRVFANYTLGKGWGLQAFSFFRGRQVQLQGSQGGFGIYSLNVRKEFNEKRGSIGFGAENFFTPNFKMRDELNSPQITQRSVNVMHNMNFKINFSYRIGKNNASQPKRRTKSISNDDLKEGGSNDGQGGGMQPAAPTGGGGGQQGPPAGQGKGQWNGGKPGTGESQSPTQNKGALEGQKPTERQNSDSTSIREFDGLKNSPSDSITPVNQSQGNEIQQVSPKIDTTTIDNKVKHENNPAEILPNDSTKDQMTPSNGTTTEPSSKAIREQGEKD